MKKLNNGSRLLSSFIVSHSVVYLLYWLSGGILERNLWLGATEIVAMLLWERLLKSRDPKAPLKESHAHDTEYL